MSLVGIIVYNVFFDYTNLLTLVSNLLSHTRKYRGSLSNLMIASKQLPTSVKHIVSYLTLDWLNLRAVLNVIEQFGYNFATDNAKTIPSFCYWVFQCGLGVSLRWPRVILIV